MRKVLVMTVLTTVLSASQLAQAQNRGIRFGVANSTPFMVPRFNPGPIPGYVRNPGSVAVRRFYAPVTRPFVRSFPIIRNVVTGGVGTAGTVAAGSAAFGGAALNFATPGTAYAPGRPPYVGPCQYTRCR